MKLCRDCSNRGQTKFCRIGYEDMVNGGAKISVPMRQAREIEAYCGAGARCYVDKDEGKEEPGDNVMYVETGRDEKGAEYVRVVVTCDGIPEVLAAVDKKGRLYALCNNDARKARDIWHDRGGMVDDRQAGFNGLKFALTPEGVFYYYRLDGEDDTGYLFDFKMCLPMTVDPYTIKCHEGTSTPILHTR